MSDARIRWISVGALALVALYAFSRLELTNSIQHFLPAGDDDQTVELSMLLVDSPLARRMVVSIGGGAKRGEVAAGLADSLRSHPEVEWVESGLDGQALRDLYTLYFDRRVYFVSDEPGVAIPATFEPRALEERAERLRRRLAQPSGVLTARTAAADPLGLFDRIVERIRGALPVLTRGRTGFTSGDGEHAIVLLGLRSSPFDSERQAELLASIDSEFARLDAQAGGGHQLELSGVNRIAIASERSIRRDANRISAVSISVVCALFLLVFRSLRHLAIAVLAPLGGFAVAMAVAASGSDRVHGITLGFGFVLIGVAIDYPIHLMNHHALAPAGSPARETLRRIRSSLLLSGLTTTLAFVALAWSDFPGLREMGTFAAIGVPVALAITVIATPAFLRPSASPGAAQRSLAARLDSFVRWLAAHRSFAALLFAACVGIAAAGVPKLRWEDDPATLMAVDPALLAESERVRARIIDFDGGRFVVGLAGDSEAALQLNDRIHAQLRQAVAAGQLGGQRSLHAFLWSDALQRANLEALQAVPRLEERIDDAYSRHGFRPGAFHDFAAAVSAPAAAPLRPADFAGSALARTLDSLFELDGRWAAVTYLRGVESGDAVRAALAGLPGAHYIDQKEIVGRLYAGYRRSTVRMILLGCGVVLAVLLLRYRSLRHGLLASVSALLAALTTFGVFGVLGVPVNVVSAVSLLVVLGMGVDYGIFSVDSARRTEHLGATFTSILVSALTSLSVFGALASSSQPALRAIGLTTGTGILFALALSPAIFAWVHTARREAP